MQMKKEGTIFIIVAAVLYGSVGIFLRYINPSGLSSMQLNTVRCWLSVVMLAVWILCTDRRAFQIEPKDIVIFIGSGGICMLGFNVLYLYSIELVGVSIGAILIYTSPVYALIISAVVFHEKITGKCIAALLITVVGIILASGITGGTLNIVGILSGVAAGFFYSLYGIFGKLAVKKRYKPLCISFYTTLCCAVTSTAISGLRSFPEEFTAHMGKYILYIALLSLFCFVLPYTLYMAGLRTVQPGRASMLLALEPAAATVIGLFLYHERLSISALFGIVMIAVSVLMIASEQSGEKRQVRADAEG